MGLKKFKKPIDSQTEKEVARPCVNKSQEVDCDAVATVEKEKKDNSYKTKSNIFFAKFSNRLNLISIAIFMFLTLNSLRKTESGSVMFYLTLGFVAVYLLVFLTSVIMSFFTHKNAKETVRNAKVVATTLNTTRKLIVKVTLLLNLIVAGLFTLQSFEGGVLEKVFSMFSLGIAVLLTVFSILRKTRKIGKTVKKEKLRKTKITRKTQKKVENKEKINSIKYKIKTKFLPGKTKKTCEGLTEKTNGEANNIINKEIK